jgi:hypothetical protein
MEASGRVVYRAWRDDLEDERIRRQAETRRAELAQLQAERAEAMEEERKAKLKARVDEARAKCKAASDQAEARIDRLRQETKSKIKALQDQAASAKRRCPAVTRAGIVPSHRPRASSRSTEGCLNRGLTIGD